MKPQLVTQTRRAFVLAGVMISALGCAGCGQHGSPSDPDQGRKLLLTALEAWKGGEGPGALARRTPPLHVSDGEWMSGFRLLDYKAESAGRLIGSDVNYNVVLQMKTAGGRLLKREAVYAVTTHPQLMVLRQDSL